MLSKLRNYYAIGVEVGLDPDAAREGMEATVPLVARILMGGLCGACLCAASNQSLIIGAILGSVGGVIGAFAGYEIRENWSPG